MTRRLLTLGMMLCLAFSAAHAQMKKLDFERYKLDNGLTVLLHDNKTAPIVTVNVFYHVGSKNEAPGRSGFAHFFEHLMFEGSENIDRGEFDKYLAGVGGSNNATTDFDRTLYFETVPSNELGLALWMESERMLHAKVDIKGVETQREVVKEERRLRYDNQPYGTFLEEVVARIFEGSPYAITPIGTMEDLDAAEEEDFTTFYKDFYRPDNAVLSIVGDLDIPETKKMVEKYFASIPSPKTPIYRPKLNIKPITAEVIDTVYDNIQLPALITAYQAPAQYSDDYYAIEMMNNILASGQSSRIYKSLVDDKKLALQAASIQLALESSGMNVVFGIANMGASLDDMGAAMDAEVERIQSELISEREFQKIRNQVESNFVYNFASNSGIASSLATYEAYQGDANLINTEIEKYLAVTKEDIKRVANKYLKKDNRVVLYWLPKAN